MEEKQVLQGEWADNKRKQIKRKKEFPLKFKNEMIIVSLVMLKQILVQVSGENSADLLILHSYFHPLLHGDLPILVNVEKGEQFLTL